MNNNIFLKGFISLIKVIALCAVTYLTLLLFYAQDKTQLGIDIFVLIFISLPTIFIIFFKKDFLAKHTKFAIPWKIYSVFYVIFIILYIGLWIFGNWHINYLKETQKTIDFINSKKITLDDVMGKNLPPAPDHKLNDSTIAGIDANNNYIRDDVELAIFKEYPNSARIRSAELQYAQALQLELTQVSNSETLIATIKKENSAYGCLSDSDLSSPLSVIDAKVKEMTDIILNTSLRTKEQSDNYKKYMTSYSLPTGPSCDLNISSLPN